VSTKSITFALLTSLSILAAGCGVSEQGQTSSLARITLLEAASGAKPDGFGGTLLSDVTTMVKGQATIFNDSGRVTLAVSLKDTGAPGAPNTPSPLNSVTFTHYRVVYRRTDGRNVEGVDVPFAFDSGLTFTVPPDGTAQMGFEIVRHTAKEEAPLRALQASGAIINTVTDVTFYGKDQGGKSVQVTGSIGINFGDFGDPTS
jgi:hypothetical protein